MKIHSASIEHGQPIPVEFTLGVPGGFGGNRNPQIAWDDVPPGTQSFALLCIDTDAPTDPSLAGKDDAEIPVEHPRGDFVHWAMVDLAPGLREIAAGACSDGVDKGGKADPPGPQGARQGLNDYTAWFKGDPELGGWYHGYDGPYPPPNDRRTHRYFFRVFALDVATLELSASFTAAQVLRAMQGHVLAEAATYGTYSLNAKAAPQPG